MTTRRCFLLALASYPVLLACTPTNPAGAEEPGKTIVAPEAEPEPAIAPTPLARDAVARGLVSAQFIPQYDSVLPAATANTTELNVLIRLEASEDEQAQTQRPPLDLAIVLDRSGSMSGDKLRYAKQAGLDLLAKLDDRDRVTLITYDDIVTTNVVRRVSDRDGVELLRRELLDISDGGTTALGPALFRALGILGDKPTGAQFLSHVILLSDGLANVGEQRPQVIGEAAARGFGNGTSVSTLGMGLDYNEDLMTKIADEGGGRYHFIEDAEHIPAVLDDELAGLTSTVASEVGIEFAAAHETSVEAVHGYVSETKDNLTDIRVGYLSAGQERDIIAKLHIPNEQLRGNPGDLLELGLITVRFRLVDPSTEQAPMMTLQLPAEVRLAGSDADARASEHTEVTVRVAEIEAAAAMQAASAAVDRGDFGAAEEIFRQQNAEFDTQYEASTNKAEKEKIRTEQAELEQAQSELEEAKHSEAKRKKYSKQYKSSSYSKGKGSKKKKAVKKSK